ncbi:MAG: glycosyltransferase family 4 protein [Chloroflexi bacterium]|nr:glycosyltransferase family 4 protein [Chloroflexota bacterium]
MNILQVVHQFLPRYVGGTEVYTANLALGLRNQGHAVSVFAGDDAAGVRTWQGVPVYTVVGGLRGPRGVVGTFLTVFGNSETSAAFDRTLDACRPEVVHFHHLGGLSTDLPARAAARGIPTLLTLHDYWLTCANAQLLTEDGRLCHGPIAGINCGRCAALRLQLPPLALLAPLAAPAFVLRERRIRAALASVGLVLAPSDFIAGIARRSGVPQERLRRVSFGIRPEEVRPPEGTAAPAPNGDVRLTYLGSLARQKGVHVLVEAFQRLGDVPARLRLYGDPASYPDYAARLRELAHGNPRIVFEGPLPRERLGVVLAATDALVVPSVWYENAPLVVREAHAAGVPVLASDVGALAEMVRHGTDGLLFRCGDAGDLARVLRTLVQEPGILTYLRANIGPVKPQEVHIAEMEALYREALAQGRGAAQRVPSGG